MMGTLVRSWRERAPSVAGGQDLGVGDALEFLLEGLNDGSGGRWASVGSWLEAPAG
jgi:hypothetical protein